VRAVDTNVLVRYYLRDALHLAASHACSELLTFDDRGYARRAAKLGVKPPVTLATA